MIIKYSKISLKWISYLDGVLPIAENVKSPSSKM